MIKCFKEIKNLGAYENFIWTQFFSENTKKDGVKNHYFFGKVNIIYGQNYAGVIIPSIRHLINRIKLPGLVSV